MTDGQAVMATSEVAPTMTDASGGVNTTVNVTVGTQPIVILPPNTGPSFAVRAVWFIFIGWWLSGIAMFVAWLLAASVVGLPFAFMLFNKIPLLQTLRARTLGYTAVTDTNGNLVLSTSKAVQLPLGVRAVYFVFAGWYLGLAATMLAWFLSLGIVTIPLSVMLIDRLPAIITLQKN